MTDIALLHFQTAQIFLNIKLSIKPGLHLLNQQNVNMNKLIVLTPTGAFLLDPNWLQISAAFSYSRQVSRKRHFYVVIFFYKKILFNDLFKCIFNE